MKAKFMLKSLALLAFSLSMVGCVSIGTKTETTIVHSSFVAYDERLSSVMVIATNEPIPVTVGDEAYSEKDLGGYVVLHHTEASYFLDLVEAEVKREGDL